MTKAGDNLSEVIFSHGLTLSKTSPGCTCLQYMSFENTVAKGEIAHNEQFLLFPLFPRELYAIIIEFEIVICNLF